MSLRRRLIVAFLCLSVIPLSAVTAFWYASQVNACERAAQREATQTAAEIGRRMERVTNAVGSAEPLDDATMMALKIEELTIEKLTNG